MSKRLFNKTLTAEWLEEMRRDLKPGDTIMTVLRGVSSSGMSRHIDVYRFTVEDGKARKYWLSPRVAAVCGFTFDEKKECIRISGCGMDMGFSIVYQLGRVLWPDGFADEGVGPGGHNIRPATRDQVERAKSLGYVFRGRNGDTSGWDNDGGYALRQEWI